MKTTEKMMKKGKNTWNKERLSFEEIKNSAKKKTKTVSMETMEKSNSGK